MDPKNREFVNLMQHAGWSQAETARRLHISPSSVSEFCSGKAMPSNSTLNLLKLVVAGRKPEVLRLKDSPEYDYGLPPWASDLLAELERVPEAEREKLLPIIKSMIRAVYIAPAKYSKTK